MNAKRNATITVDDGKVGEAVSIEGTGFAPGEFVGMFVRWSDASRLGSDSWYIGATTDAKTGALRALFTPEVAGPHTIELWQSGRKRPLVVFEFQVTA